MTLIGTLIHALVGAAFFDGTQQTLASVLSELPTVEKRDSSLVVLSSCSLTRATQLYHIIHRDCSFSWVWLLFSSFLRKSHVSATFLHFSNRHRIHFEHQLSIVIRGHLVSLR